MILEKKRLNEILTNIKGKSILVMGDFCLDAYWIANMELSSLSLETPRFPRPVIEERYSPGAGGNVACNAVDIGLKVYTFYLMGNDWRGELLKKALDEIGVNTDCVYSLEDRVTPAYIKPIIVSSQSKQEDSRLDFNNYSKSHKEFIKSLIPTLKEIISKIDAVVIEDQLEYGLFSSEYLINGLNKTAKESKMPFMVDSRYRINKFKNMILKPNISEIVKEEYRKDKIKSDKISEEEIESAANKLYLKSKAPIYITAGERGLYLFYKDNGNVFQNIPTIKVPHPIDITGAGDTVMVAITASLLGGATYLEAGMIANIASSITIKKINETGTATPSEILEKYKDFKSVLNA